MGWVCSRAWKLLDTTVKAERAAEGLEVRPWLDCSF